MAKNIGDTLYESGLLAPVTSSDPNKRDVRDIFMSMMGGGNRSGGEENQSKLEQDVNRQQMGEKMQAAAPIIQNIKQRINAQGSSLPRQGSGQGMVDMKNMTQQGYKGGGLYAGDFDPKTGEVNPELLAGRENNPNQTRGIASEQGMSEQEAAKSGLVPQARKGGGSGFDFGRVGFGILQDMMESAPGTKPGSSGIMNIYEDALKKQAFRNSTNEDGVIDKQKLVQNLLKNGFGQDALNIQNSEEKSRAGIAKVLIGQQAKDRMNQQNMSRQEKLDAIAERRVIAQEGELKRKIKQAELETGVSFGGQRPGGSIARQPQSIEQGGVGRGPAAFGQAPGEVTNSNDYSFSENYNNVGKDNRPVPVTYKQKEQRASRIDKEIKTDLGVMSSWDNQKALSGLSDVKKQVGMLQGDDLRVATDSGQFKGSLEKFYKSPGFEQLQASLRGLSFKNIPKGMSRLFDSEAERKMYEESQPSTNNSPTTNYNLITYAEAGTKTALDYANFKKAYGRMNGGLQGSDEAWSSYITNNPKLIKNQNGLFVENSLALNPKQYFSQEAQGAIPIPIDYDAMEKKYSKRGFPIKNIPKETINSLDDNAIYMTPKGPESGRILKGMYERVNGKGGG